MGYNAVVDHDRLFKELLTTFFADFLRLFLPEVGDYVDFASFEFLDKEMFTDVTAGEKHEADLVVKAPAPDELPVTVAFPGTRPTW